MSEPGLAATRSRALLREVSILLVLMLLVWFASRLRFTLGVPAGEPGSGLVIMTLGFALLAAHLCGRLIGAATLPQITGYLLAGVLLGPYVLGLVGHGVRDQLSVINEVALGLIALSAGGELALERLRPRFRSIGWIGLLQTVVVFGTTTAGFLGLAAVCRRADIPLGLTTGLARPQLLALGLILGLVATANSPATAIAVINETRSRGPLTTLSLGVTVLKDVVVIVLLGVTLSLAATLVDPDRAFHASLFGQVLLEIAVSLLVGALAGGLLIAYLRWIGKETALFVLAMVFLAGESVRWIAAAWHVHAHFLLIAMTAGFVVENFSRRGEPLIRGIERSSLPIYVVFFTLSGVGLDLDALGRVWPLAIAFVVWRGGLLFVTSWTGARIPGEPPAVRINAWTAFIAQAGVSLGLAELVAERFPEMGHRVKTLILAVIAIHQLVGPVLFKIALRRSGEAGAADEDELLDSSPARRDPAAG